MITVAELLQKLTAVFYKSSHDRELDEELASHLELATDEYLHQGLSPQEARRKAVLRLGGIEQSQRGTPRRARLAVAGNRRPGSPVRGPCSSPRVRLFRVYRSHHRRWYHSGCGRLQHREQSAGSSFCGIGDVRLTAKGEPERLTAAPVTENFFRPRRSSPIRPVLFGR